MATEVLRPDADINQYPDYSWTNGSSYVLYSYINEASPDDAATVAVDIYYNGISYFHVRLPDSSIPDGAVINSVTLYVRGYIENSRTTGGWWDCGINIGSDYYCGINHNDTSWATKSHSWNINPNSGVAWTKQNINDLQIAIKGYAIYGSDKGGQYLSRPRITQAYLVVDYTIPTFTFQPRSLSVGVDQRY